MATLPDIEAAFATNAIRLQLLGEFRRFIRERLVQEASDLDLIACGSYFSDKAAPSDIDCTVVLPVANVASHGGLLQLLNDGRSATVKGAIWDEYRVDVHPSITGVPGLNDFVAFFQYVGVKSASLKNLQPTDKRGIVKVDQWIHG